MTVKGRGGKSGKERERKKRQFVREGEEKDREGGEEVQVSSQSYVGTTTLLSVSIV